MFFTDYEVKKGQFSESEKIKFKDELKKMGASDTRCWGLFAKNFFPGRTGYQCYFHYKNLLDRKEIDVIENNDGTTTIVVIEE